MRNWSGFQVSDLPRIAEQVCFEEKQSLERLRQLNAEKTSLDVELASLNVNRIALLMELAAVTPAGVATAAADGLGAELIESVAAQIEQNEAAILRCTAKLNVVQTDISNEKERLQEIRTDKQQGQKEIDFRAEKLSSVEDMGKVIGHYKPFAKKLIQEYEIMGDQLQRAGHTLGNAPNTSIHITSPEQTVEQKHCSSIKSGVSSTANQKSGSISRVKSVLSATRKRDRVISNSALFSRVYKTKVQTLANKNRPNSKTVPNKRTTQSKKNYAFVDNDEDCAFHKFQRKMRIMSSSKKTNGSFTQSGHKTTSANSLRKDLLRSTYSEFIRTRHSPVRTEEAIARFVSGAINGNKRVYSIRPHIERMAFPPRSVVLFGSSSFMDTRIVRTKTKTKRNCVVKVNSSLASAVLPKMRQDFIPSNTHIKGSQKPDVYSLKALSKGIFHISEAKNYCIENEDGLNNLFADIFKQACKRITHSIGAYVPRSYSGLDKGYKIKKLKLDFYIDFKGHYKTKSELESLKYAIKQKCDELYEKLQRSIPSGLLEKSRLNFYALDSMEYEEVLQLIDLRKNVFNISVRDTDKRVQLATLRF